VRDRTNESTSRRAGEPESRGKEGIKERREKRKMEWKMKKVELKIRNET
jgi:hypothetical protein